MSKIHVKLGSAVPAGITVDTDLMVPGQIGVYQKLWDESPALRYIVEYGFKQTLNDKLAGYMKKYPATTPEMALAVVQKKLDAIIAGTIAVRDGGTRITDPVAREARRLATLAWDNDYTDQQRKVALTRHMRRESVDEKIARSAIITAIAATDSMMERARKNVADLPVVDLDTISPDSDEESEDNE
jgi:hypothetical protein